MISKGEKIGLAVGRILLSVIFLVSGVFKLTAFAGVAAMMASKGIPLAKAALVLTLLIEIGGGLLLLTGFQARIAAIVMALFLVPVTLTFHNFWAYQGAEQQEQMANFMKNLAIVGGLLVVAATSRAARPAGAELAGKSAA
jgi:putative oxidoreductase